MITTPPAEPSPNADDLLPDRTGPLRDPATLPVGPPPVEEYVITSALIIVTIIVAFWAAGKVFRIGVLMTGKPPKVREILGWIKAPAGAVAVRKED